MYRAVENRVAKSRNEKVHRLKERILRTCATYNIVVSFCEQHNNTPNLCVVFVSNFMKNKLINTIFLSIYEIFNLQKKSKYVLSFD